MALCRCVQLSSSLYPHRSPLPPPSSTYLTPFFLNFSVFPFFFRSPPSAVSSFALQSTSSSLSSMEVPPEGYRRNVGICLINPSKKIFAASRLDVPDAWQMPQGGIDDGEDPNSAAIRELREETGVTSVELLGEVPFWLTYDFPPDVREKLNRLWGSDWKGQAQKWFLLKLMGNEDEINLLGDGTEKPEFGNWSWMSPDEIIEKAVDFKKPVYREVLSVFNPTFIDLRSSFFFSNQIRFMEVIPTSKLEFPFDIVASASTLSLKVSCQAKKIPSNWNNCHGITPDVMKLSKRLLVIDIVK